jgi:tight adherence protein C
MLGVIYDAITDPTVLMAMCAAIAVFATIYTLSMPYFEGDQLGTRIKAVALEREAIRARERARLAAESKRASLRAEPKAFMRQIVDQLNLRNLLADQKTLARLRMAGYRGQAPLVVFLFARVTFPLVFFAVSLFYLLAVMQLDQPPLIKVAMAIGIAYVGFYTPNLYVSNVVSKRQKSIRRAWPDALDLLLICVEAGTAGRGTHPGDRRDVLPARAAPGLREPRRAHRP